MVSGVSDPHEAQSEGTTNFLALLAQSMALLGNFFASSLGPFGFKKAILCANNEIIFAKDGFTIASAQTSGGIAGKIALEVASTMQGECGDGANSAIVLIGKLMDNAMNLVTDGLHPNTVSQGYGIAVEECLGCLARISKAAVADSATVERLVRTSLGTKLNRKDSVRLARLVTEAVFKATGNGNTLEAFDPQSINIAGLVSGFGPRAELMNGVLLDKTPAAVGMPGKINSAKVAIVNSLDLKDFPFDTTMVLSNPDSLGRMVEQETAALNAFVEKIEGMKVNFIACRGGIDDQVERILAHDGILAVKNLKDEDIRMVERSTGGKSAPFSALLPSDLGMAKRVEWKGEAVGGLKIAGTTKVSSSIVMKRGNRALLDAEVRAVKAAIRLISCFIRERRVIAGGGAADAELREALKKRAKSSQGRTALAIDAFGESLMVTSHSLAENGGLDPYEAVARLIAAHSRGDKGACLDLRNGRTADAFGLGLIEPLALKRQLIISAGEAAQAMLKCDEALASARRYKGRVA